MGAVRVIVDERLFCRCGIEVKVARLVPSGLGHVTRPPARHAIRLLRIQVCRDCGKVLPKSGHQRQRCEACWRVYEPTYREKSGGPDACWPWLGPVDEDGYGRDRPHRRAYRYAVGPITGPVLRHSCDNPPCCNPAHLIPGTHAENVADRVARGRSARGDRSGARLHPERMASGSRNGNARFSEEQVDQILERIAAGERHADIAADHGVARSTVTAISTGQNWQRHHAIRLLRPRLAKPGADSLPGENQRRTWESDSGDHAGPPRGSRRRSAAETQPSDSSALRRHTLQPASEAPEVEVAAPSGIPSGASLAAGSRSAAGDV